MPELQILTFAQFELTTAEILFVIITRIVFGLKQFHIFIHLFNIFQEIILFYLTIGTDVFILAKHSSDKTFNTIGEFLNIFRIRLLNLLILEIKNFLISGLNSHLLITFNLFWSTFCKFVAQIIIPLNFNGLFTRSIVLQVIFIYLWWVVFRRTHDLILKLVDFFIVIAIIYSKISFKKIFTYIYLNIW